MRSPKSLTVAVSVLCNLLLSVVFSMAALAQTDKEFTVNVKADDEMLRVTSQDAIALRIEVLAANRGLYFDSGFQSGDTLSWPLREEDTQLLIDNLFICRVTAKYSEGKISERKSLISIQGDNKVRVKALPDEPAPDSTLEAASDSQAEQTPLSNLIAAPQGVPALAMTTISQRYSGKATISCPSGYLAVVASCNAGVNVVMQDTSTPTTSGRWVWYLIPNKDAATGVQCEGNSVAMLRCAKVN
jgi:hypothetical protein